MMGTNGAAAKVETKHVKKEIHERRKVRMCGLMKEKRRNDLALFSESTGSVNLLAAAVPLPPSEPASTSIAVFLSVSN
jgi:uncharacterized protein YdeI (BOF family)